MTSFAPGKMADPTLSWTFEVFGSTASGPISPQSIDSAQRPAVNRLRIADIEIDLVRRPVLRRFGIEVERLAEALIVDERLHVPRIEESALIGALRLDVSAGNGRNEPIGLRVPLLADAGAIIRLAVTEILAVQRFGVGEVVVPSCRGFEPVLLEHIGTVVDHVEVAIERDEICLLVELGGEVPEERCDTIPTKSFVPSDTTAELLEQAGSGIVTHPLRRKDCSVDRIGAGRPVGQQLGVKIRERDGDDVDL